MGRMEIKGGKTGFAEMAYQLSGFTSEFDDTI